MFVILKKHTHTKTTQFISSERVQEYTNISNNCNGNPHLTKKIHLDVTRFLETFVQNIHLRNMIFNTI